MMTLAPNQMTTDPNLKKRLEIAEFLSIKNNFGSVTHPRASDLTVEEIYDKTDIRLFQELFPDRSLITQSFVELQHLPDAQSH